MPTITRPKLVAVAGILGLATVFGSAAAAAAATPNDMPHPAQVAATLKGMPDPAALKGMPDPAAPKGMPNP